MKRFLYPIAIIALFAACRHQKAATTASATTYTQQPAETTTTTTTITTTTTPPAEGVVTTTVPAEETGTTTEGGNTTTTTVTAPADSTQNLNRVTVSFISRGEGIDYKTQETLENWLRDHPKHPAYEKTHYGREGETNYCLKLAELSTREQEIFVKDLRTLLANKDLVLVAEYAPCKGHR